MALPDHPVVFTVGHGNRSLEALLEVLRSAHVALLVDVRRTPGSRRHPHFGRETLEAALPGVGIEYSWRGEDLGGRREPSAGPSRHPAWRNSSFRSYDDHMDTPAFREALTRLQDEAALRAPAVMCAETLWWNCHRRLIADALVVRGVEVTHLLAADKRQPHPLHPGARPDEDGWPVYDVGVTQTLGLEGN